MRSVVKICHTVINYSQGTYNFTKELYLLMTYRTIDKSYNQVLYSADNKHWRTLGKGGNLRAVRLVIF